MAYVRTRLGRLFYDERGAARRKGDPAIVLLHGLLYDGGMWRGEIEALASLGRVVVFDGPGHGKSEPGPRFMLEDHADALYDAFGELGIEKAVSVGLSWGGMVSLRLAIQHPDRVAGIVVMDASASAEPLANKVKYRALIAMHRRVGFPYSLFEKEIAPLMFSARTRRERKDLLERSYTRAMGFDRGGLCRAAIAVVVHRKDITAKLGAITCPTLVMCGSEDAAQPPAESEKIAKAIPGAELVVLDGLGHMSALEDPEAVNARLIPFVGDCFGD
jgi:3-oxoadipate enol-lactonase